MDKKVIIPITTAQSRITGKDMVDHFWVKTTSIDTVDIARGEASSNLEWISYLITNLSYLTSGSLHFYYCVDRTDSHR